MAVRLCRFTNDQRELAIRLDIDASDGQDFAPCGFDEPVNIRSLEELITRFARHFEPLMKNDAPALLTRERQRAVLISPQAHPPAGHFLHQLRSKYQIGDQNCKQRSKTNPYPARSDVAPISPPLLGCVAFVVSAK
jgi:hypothetical protein